MKYDYIVVGAGLAGIIIARCLADKDKKVLILEKRDHIGGNCYDEKIEGVLIHRYGPHIFHTNNEKVWNYLNQFTEFNDYKHKVKVEVNNKLVDLPINLNSIDDIYFNDKILFHIHMNELQHEFGKKSEVSIYDLLKSKNDWVQSLGDCLYRNIYENYSKKQWGTIPNKNVLDRILIRCNCISNYFLDKYQGLPINGYTVMFENMLFHKNIEVRLNSNWKLDDISLIKDNNIIYTGMIDALFDYKYGKLPYRSLDIEFKEYKKEYYQEYPVINYPNKKHLTRKTEYKYLTKQVCATTVISKEYPCEYDGNNIPYYPIPTNDTQELYNKYKQDADKIPNLYLLGRLAEYKYYDMDKVVEKALELGEKL